jgi:hypothetical protein
MLGGFNIKINIWTRCFDIAFVIVCAFILCVRNFLSVKSVRLDLASWKEWSDESFQSDGIGEKRQPSLPIMFESYKCNQAKIDGKIEGAVNLDKQVIEMFEVVSLNGGVVS